MTEHRTDASGWCDGCRAFVAPPVGPLPATRVRPIRSIDHRTGAHVTAPTPAPARLECERCGETDVAAGVELRTLFGRRDLTSAVLLCADCNDAVQGPDHIDVTTQNRYPR